MPDISTESGGSLVRRAMDAISAHIAVHRLHVGDTLPGEAHFATSLGVSRAVMREAFGALAALKLLDVGNGRRARVGAMDGSVMATSLTHAISTDQVSVAEIWDVRRTLEHRTAALAAANRTDEEAARIIAVAEAMASETSDLPQITRHDIEFHETIARAGRNALFLQIVQSFGPLMQIAVPAAWRTRTAVGQRQIMIDHHRAIAAAIAARDEAGASAAMEAHFHVAIGSALLAATRTEPNS
ncbi:MAG: GntR family transcriptional regulator [Sphingomonas bacterium]|uniref:FadR/GntR family transcriptional regulator n=1 Tax=Sphingomonas bacterium TaxID=1895847 RepID=UPI0026036C23|nr:FCD domain-containing protein [Sphingomonas bacterium]MDB5703040.1 GntR family transcriptional regulator [Sphingomonas bacterium]